MTNAQNAIDFLMGGVDTTAADERAARRDASQVRCSLPDWTGQGGIVEFWQNADGSYELMHIRVSDGEIRDGMRALAAEHANQSDLGRQARINGLPCSSTDAAWIEGWCSVDGPPKIEAIDRTIQYGSCTLVGFFSDNAERALFSYYIDELSFADSELIGLTEDEAHKLFRSRDVAYLRS